MNVSLDFESLNCMPKYKNGKINNQSAQQSKIVKIESFKNWIDFYALMREADF